MTQRNPAISGTAGFLGLLCTLSQVPAQLDRKSTTSAIEAAGGEVSLQYLPVGLPARPIEDHQSVGNVWSMSDREAAVLETDVALVAGKVLIPPGRHRLSTWFKAKGDWRLLVFSSGENYKRGTPYRSIRLGRKNLDRASQLLRLELVSRRDIVHLHVFAGTTRLRATFKPLPVIRHKGELGGAPAEFEFYAYPAEFRLQQRLRNLELIPFGRVRQVGKYGASYDLSCKSDGKGIFVMGKSTSLRDHRKLLEKGLAALREHPGDKALKADVVELRQAVSAQSRLHTSVMVPGSVEKVQKRAGKLRVSPILDSDGNAFELSFGIRKARFVLNPGDFQKLKWR